MPLVFAIDVSYPFALPRCTRARSTLPPPPLLRTQGLMYGACLLASLAAYLRLSSACFPTDPVPTQSSTLPPSSSSSSSSASPPSSLLALHRLLQTTRFDPQSMFSWLISPSLCSRTQISSFLSYPPSSSSPTVRSGSVLAQISPSGADRTTTT
ncbi:hypothetical protein LY76DRAFT_221294 [Colletotrichum caudatum]|nr:hypothetical protein LY76DRAFT_221294 [Colletotrichum caudatum]